MWIFILSCFVLALAIFSAVALLRMPTKSSAPLIAIMESASQSGDALVVSGKVENKSEKLYGVPDLVVMIKGDKDAELASMKFAPPVPLLDAGESARFSVVVPSIPVGIKKISVELDSQ
jgi:hypothetical protein